LRKNALIAQLISKFINNIFVKTCPALFLRLNENIEKFYIFSQKNFQHTHNERKCVGVDDRLCPNFIDFSYFYFIEILDFYNFRDIKFGKTQ